MPGGPELIIILVVLAIPVAIVLLIMALSGSRTAVPNSGDTIALSGDARTWLELVASDIHHLNGHRIEWLSADVIQVSWRHRSGWVFIVAIILFPFGLFALLFTVTSYGTIVVGSRRFAIDDPSGRRNVQRGNRGDKRACCRSSAHDRLTANSRPPTRTRQPQQIRVSADHP